jgi:hypothetical protein
MNGYYRSRSWSTGFARVTTLRRKDGMPPQRCLLVILMTWAALMLAVVAPVAAVQPEREEVLLPEDPYFGFGRLPL